jgi:CRP/FNR family transcriptional regulator
MYKPRQVIFSEGNPSDGLYLVCHGDVKLYHSDRFGRDHILEVAGPGAVLGEFMSTGSETMSVSAEALTEAQMSFLPHDSIAAFVQKYPASAIRLIEALSRELSAARRKARDLALKSGESRLATLLLQLCRGTNGDATAVALPYRRQEIAEMIGVSTETAVRLLGRLRDRRVLSLERRELTVHDVDRLRRIARHSDVDG